MLSSSQATAQHPINITFSTARISDSSTSADLFIDHRYFVALASCPFNFLYHPSLTKTFLTSLMPSSDDSDDNIRDDDGNEEFNKETKRSLKRWALINPLIITDEWWIELINRVGGASGSAVAQTISVALPIYRSAFCTCATSHFTVFKISFRIFYFLTKFGHVRYSGLAARK